MHRYLALLGLAMAVTACSDDGDTTPTDTDTKDETCSNGIVTTYPAADATGIFYQDTFEVAFQKADESASVTLAAGGTDVPVTTKWEGDTLFVDPNSDLMPSTQYTMTVNYECGSPAVNFTTSDVGAAIADSSTLVDNVYKLDLASGNFVKPAGVGPLLQQQLTVDILIGVEDASGTEVVMLGALGAEGSNPVTQDLCQPTIDFPAADFSSNPSFEVGPQTTTLSVQGFDITIDDLFVSGAFAPDGNSIAGAVLAGAVDTRPIVPLIDPEGDDNTVCELVATFGVGCQACSDGSGDFCLELEVNRIAADGTDIAGLEVREIADITADSSCP